MEKEMTTELDHEPWSEDGGGLESIPSKDLAHHTALTFLPAWRARAQEEAMNDHEPRAVKVDDAWARKEKHLWALHNEFRVAAARLNFVANWLENTHAPGTQDAAAARGYANAAKEVLDKGLDWLVEKKRH